MESKKVDKGFYALIFLIILLILVILFSYPINCKNDPDCFSKASKKCSKARFSFFVDGISYTYEIKGKKQEICLGTVFLNKLDEDSDYKLKSLLENKGMFCEIPLELLKETPYHEIPEMNTYCTGPLKEAYMRLTIEKLYTIVVQNIGDITAEMKKAL